MVLRAITTNGLLLKQRGNNYGVRSHIKSSSPIIKSSSDNESIAVNKNAGGLDSLLNMVPGGLFEDTIVSAATLEQKSEIYLLSPTAITPDHPAKSNYLRELELVRERFYFCSDTLLPITTSLRCSCRWWAYLWQQFLKDCQRF